MLSTAGSWEEGTRTEDKASLGQVGGGDTQGGLTEEPWTILWPKDETFPELS